LQDSGLLEITPAGPGITLGGDTTMKLTLTSLAALLVAGSLVAATEKPAIAQTTTTAFDSPLVAAAKKSNRMGKKRVVITNESLKGSKGHISTTKMQTSFTVAEPAKTQEQVMAETKAKEKERTAQREKLVKAASDAKQKQIARVVAAAEDDGPYTVDPAAVEHQLDQQTSTAATSTSSQPSKHDDTQHP